MKRRFVLCSFLLFSFLLLFITNCKKEDDTFFKGRITDVKTGIPLEGVNLQYGISNANTFNGGIYNIKTDSNGKFIIDYGVNEAITNLIITKTGYVTKSHFGLPPNESENGLEVIMYPKDGVLRLTIENVTGQFDSIYFGAYSPIFASEMRLSSGILISFQGYNLPLLIGETYSDDIPVASEENIQIYWGYEKLHPYYLLKNAPFRDSLFVNQNDTAYYKISF